MISKIIEVSIITLLFCLLCITLSLASQNTNINDSYSEEEILQSNPFNINLFGAITYLPQNEESFLEFMTEGKDYFYEIGTRGSYYFENAFSLNGQISKHGAEDLDIDFLTLRYTNSVNSRFSYDAEIGKVRLDIGFLAAGRLNPRYRWNIVLPQALYSTNVKRFTSGGWGISFKPTYIFDNGWGVTTNFAFFKPGKCSDETLVNTFYGPTVDGDYNTGRGIAMNAQLFSPTEKYQAHYTFAYVYDGVFTPSGLPPMFTKDYDQEIMLNQIGFQQNIGNFSWLTEARYLQTWNDFYTLRGDNKRQDVFGFNCAARYWVNENIVATLFGYSYWTDEVDDWDGRKKAKKLGTDRYAHIQHDFYATIVYKFNKHLDFKLEYHRMIGTAVVNGESNDMQTLPHEWDLVAAQISFNF